MMAECPCTNISIMQLFHELKQKFPAIPDRVVNECIRQNGHDKGACEWVLERENRSYLLHSYPAALVQGSAAPTNPSASAAIYGMSVDCGGGGCCHEGGGGGGGGECGPPDHVTADRQQRQQVAAGRFDRHLPGRQSLDSIGRRAGQQRKNVTFKHYSDEHLYTPPSSYGNATAIANDDYTVLPLPHPSFLYDNFGPYRFSELPRQQQQHGYCSHRSSAFEGSDTSFHGEAEHYGSRVSCENRELSSPSSSSARVGESDLKLEFAAASDESSCRCTERTSVSVVSSYAERALPPVPFHHMSRSAPVTPCGCQPPLFPPLTVDVTTRRHRTALSVEPTTTPFLGCQAAVAGPEAQRPFTSVNLTLRPPSSDPQPPIDIRSAGGGLTYSTCSYDPRQGYRSRLQISIGPGSRGSVSAARTRACGASSSSGETPVLRSATSMPDVATTSSLLTASDDQHPPLELDTQALVNKQLERKQRLEKELQKEKEKLIQMQQNVIAMEQRLSQAGDQPSATVTPSRPTRVQELRDEILRLREECKRMTSEVDLSTINNVPLGETSEEFYRHIYTGQRGTCIVAPSALSTTSTSSTNGLERGPRIAVAATADPSGSEQRGVAAGGGDGPSWTCHVCTFRNHPLLDKCEQCEMPRIVLGTSTTASNTVAPSHARARTHPTAPLTKAQPQYSVH